tara:strand:+ start:367 stop:804 length:438 start_codon:yes stop_codon:yes gene_type:complete
MASELKVDKFTGVTTAGSIDVTGEGNSTTTNLQQGLAKAWAMNNQVTTHSNTDSFNISGITDVKTGGTTETFTNNMANQGYSGTFCSGYGTIDDASLYAVKYNAPTNNMVTTGISFTWYYGSHGTTSKQAADCTHIGMTITGDLA